MADDVTFEQWRGALDRFLMGRGLVLRASNFTTTALNEAYEGNESPEEFYDRLRLKGLLPIADAHVSVTKPQGASNMFKNAWGLLIISILIGAGATFMDVRVPGTEVVNLDLLMQRLGLQIGSEGLFIAGVLYFAADAIVKAVKESKS